MRVRAAGQGRGEAHPAAIVHDGEITTVSGGRLPVSVDKICLHGDGPNVVELARSVRAALTAAGARLARLDQTLARRENRVAVSAGGT